MFRIHVLLCLVLPPLVAIAPVEAVNGTVEKLMPAGQAGVVGLKCGVDPCRGHPHALVHLAGLDVAEGGTVEQDVLVGPQLAP
jgi:hypothetical protein